LAYTLKEDDDDDDDDDDDGINLSNNYDRQLNNAKSSNMKTFDIPCLTYLPIAFQHSTYLSFCYSSQAYCHVHFHQILYMISEL
jgi:hypothetical protein